ncbi:adenosine kinase [Parvularcula sp. ZS-1/3]|uniref:Adenosine kinase n=1 Tax=Parvularcula mediterranea TaxID=2732508 RepID=A0A7Y3W6H6_9PROT|nr:adenosine kinase [Parvularcula mediterranea]NNU17286.1 adenosine kinase [Parvularcula mediterranea]
MADIQVAALGNAIVDVIAEVDEGFLAKFEVPKGGMILIDTEKAEAISHAEEFTDTVMVAGGSAGNTCACIASLGGTARFIGTVADDKHGNAYRESLRGTGVIFDTPNVTDGKPSGRCLISVTSDAERSMATYLGAAGDITPAAVLEGDFETAQICYLEGYNFEAPESREACREAARRAKKAGRFVAMTLSDSGMVERNFEPLVAFLKETVDMIFANHDEAKALTGHDDAMEAAKAMKAEFCLWGAVTMSEKGSMVFGPQGEIEHVDAIPPAQLVDTTGAGDAYAAGWLFGFTTCMDLKSCGKLGSLCASEVISHKGARPEVSLRKLAQEKGLLG